MLQTAISSQKLFIRWLRSLVKCECYLSTFILYFAYRENSSIFTFENFSTTPWIACYIYIWRTRQSSRINLFRFFFASFCETYLFFWYIYETHLFSLLPELQKEAFIVQISQSLSVCWIIYVFCGTLVYIFIYMLWRYKQYRLKDAHGEKGIRLGICELPNCMPQVYFFVNEDVSIIFHRMTHDLENHIKEMYSELGI